MCTIISCSKSCNSLTCNQWGNGYSSINVLWRRTFSGRRRHLKNYLTNATFLPHRESLYLHFKFLSYKHFMRMLAASNDLRWVSYIQKLFTIENTICNLLFRQSKVSSHLYTTGIRYTRYFKLTNACTQGTSVPRNWSKSDKALITPKSPLKGQLKFLL